MERFFEPCWETGKAVRWSINRIDHNPFAVAAIWDQWVAKNTGEIVLSLSMLTINADGHPVMGRFHKPQDNRQSLVVMPTDRWSDWFGASALSAHDLLFKMNTVELKVLLPTTVQRVIKRQYKIACSWVCSHLNEL